eukprot:6805917-Pyramimonas_sp.AAC.2
MKPLPKKFENSAAVDSSRTEHFWCTNGLDCVRVKSASMPRGLRNRAPVSYKYDPNAEPKTPEWLK